MTAVNLSYVYVYLDGQWVIPLVYKRVNGAWVLMSVVNLLVTIETFDNFNLDTDVILTASVVESNKEIV